MSANDTHTLRAVLEVGQRLPPERAQSDMNFVSLLLPRRVLSWLLYAMEKQLLPKLSSQDLSTAWTEDGNHDQREELKATFPLFRTVEEWKISETDRVTDLRDNNADFSADLARVCGPTFTIAINDIGRAIEENVEHLMKLNAEDVKVKISKVVEMYTSLFEFNDAYVKPLRTGMKHKLNATYRLATTLLSGAGGGSEGGGGGR